MQKEITPSQLDRLRHLIAAGEEWRFYSWRVWRFGVAPAVLKLDRYECTRCKEHGRYKRAALVHHVRHLTEAPELALSIYDPSTGARQLVSVCKRCHEELHPESLHRQPRQIAPPVTSERWD